MYPGPSEKIEEVAVTEKYYNINDGYESTNHGNVDSGLHTFNVRSGADTHEDEPFQSV